MSDRCLTVALILGLGALAACPAEEAAPESRRARLARATQSYGGNMSRFGGAIVVSEVARGALEGNPDAVGDALRAPASPEFLASLAVFDGALRGSEAVARRVPTRSQLGNAVKQNLVLAGALTVASAVEVDLNGFSYRDAARLDFSRLRDARVGLRQVDGQSLAITTGAFAAAQGIWAGAKRIARPLATAVARRLARTAVIKAGLAVAPVPGTRVAALLLTGVEVALAVGDLAGLLMTAQAVDEPLQAANERRRRRAEVAEGERDASAAAVGGQARLEDALGRLRTARALERAEAYTDVAREDLAMIRRLRERGADRAVFDRIAEQALSDYGPSLALPAQSALLLEHLPQEVAAGRLSQAAFERHRDRVLRAQAEAAARRDATYGEEDETYARLLAQARTPAARDAIQIAREDAAIEAEIERDDLRQRVSAPLASARATVGMLGSLRNGMGE
ncbi:MAG: hypothetical protein R3F62_02455 [Planctomycetota bacterium]